MVAVQVCDGGTPNECATQSTPVTITAVNDPPVINSVAPPTATEDILYTYNATLSDADGLGQTWSLLGSHTCGGSIVAGTGAFTFTPLGPTPSSSCVVAVQVCDGGTPNECATQSTTVTITAVNDPPVINSVAPTTATEDILYTYNATRLDADGLGQTWSLLGSHTCGGSIVAGTGAFTFTPLGPVPPTSCVVAVQVCDGGTPNECATQSTNVTITAVNDPPVANAISPPAFAEDTQSIITLSYTDPETDLATACAVSSLTNVTETQACSCAAGVCTVGVTGTPLGYDGPASFNYTVTAATQVSNNATATLTIAGPLGFEVDNITDNGALSGCVTGTPNDCEPARCYFECEHSCR